MIRKRIVLTVAIAALVLAGTAPASFASDHGKTRPVKEH